MTVQQPASTATLTLLYPRDGAVDFKQDMEERGATADIENMEKKVCLIIKYTVLYTHVCIQAISLSLTHTHISEQICNAQQTYVKHHVLCGIKGM